MRGINARSAILLISLILPPVLAGCIEKATYHEDTITINSVTPDSGLIDGMETLFTVKGDYKLKSRSKAIILIGFNNGESIWEYIMQDYKDTVIQRGTGEFSIIVLARVKEWGTPGTFAAYVNISPYPIPTGRWTTNASCTYYIEKH